MPVAKPALGTDAGFLAIAASAGGRLGERRLLLLRPAPARRPAREPSVRAPGTRDLRGGALGSRDSYLCSDSAGPGRRYPARCPCFLPAHTQPAQTACRCHRLPSSSRSGATFPLIPPGPSPIRRQARPDLPVHSLPFTPTAGHRLGAYQGRRGGGGGAQLFQRCSTRPPSPPGDRLPRAVWGSERAWLPKDKGTSLATCAPRAAGCECRRADGAFAHAVSPAQGTSQATQ